MRIRGFDPGDVEALAGIFREAALRTGAAVYTREQVEAWALFPEDRAEFRSRLERGLTLVAEVDGEPRAFGQLDPEDHVALLYTHPDWSRRGLGSAIHLRLEEAARKAGVTLLRTEGSRIARPLFQRLGYDLVEVEISLWKGLEFERFRMAKPLAQAGDGPVPERAGRARPRRRPMPVPRLETERLVLRAFEPGDFDVLAAILTNRRVLRYFPRTEPWPADKVRLWMDSLEDHWREHGFGWFAVEHRADARLIGWCGLRILEDTGEVEVLYLFDEPWWGRGLATEAAVPCVRDGLGKYGLDRIIGLTHPENIASQKVLEHAGLRFLDEKEYFGMLCRRFEVRGGGSS